MKYIVRTITSIEAFIEANKPYTVSGSDDFVFVDKNSIETTVSEVEVFIFEITPKMGKVIHSKIIFDFLNENGWRAGTYSELLGLAEQYPDVWKKYYALSAMGTLFEHMDGYSILTVGNHPLDGRYLMLSQIDVGWFPSSKKVKRGFICVSMKKELQ